MITGLNCSQIRRWMRPKLMLNLLRTEGLMDDLQSGVNSGNGQIGCDIAVISGLARIPRTAARRASLAVAFGIAV